MSPVVCVRTPARSGGGLEGRSLAGQQEGLPQSEAGTENTAQEGTDQVSHDIK